MQFSIVPITKIIHQNDCWWRCDEWWRQLKSATVNIAAQVCVCVCVSYLTIFWGPICSQSDLNLTKLLWLSLLFVFFLSWCYVNVPCGSSNCCYGFIWHPFWSALLHIWCIRRQIYKLKPSIKPPLSLFNHPDLWWRPKYIHHGSHQNIWISTAKPGQTFFCIQFFSF